MVVEHREKVERELQSENPNRSVIAYWQKRIHTVEQQIPSLGEKAPEALEWPYEQAQG